jgi:hypothetical protein
MIGDPPSEVELIEYSAAVRRINESDGADRRELELRKQSQTNFHFTNLL